MNIDKLDSIEKRLDNRTFGMQMIGGFDTNKYLDDLNLTSFDLRHK